MSLVLFSKASEPVGGSCSGPVPGLRLSADFVGPAEGVVVDARRASAADLDLIAELRRAARSGLGASRGGPLFLRREASPVRAGSFIARSLDDPIRSAWVGSLDYHVVGYALGHVEPLGEGSPHGVLDELYVDPEARQVGVGESLLEVALEWFAAQGCAGVDAFALPGDRAVKGFFETGGFKARLLVMHRVPNPPPAGEPH
ncbi:MAG: GNAT family N-acetyltransferase [Acidimicrobiales bacterium]